MPSLPSITRRVVAAAFACGALASAHAQTGYPSRPVHFVVPASAGGPSDIVARLVADKLSQALGQPVIVDNKPGASQTLGTAFVAKAEADGYTLLFTTSTPIVLTPYTTKNITYDVKRDLTLITHVGTTPLVMYANMSVPSTSIKTLVQLAKEKPGTYTYGSYGNGSSAHLVGEYLSKQEGITLVHVPYKGVAPEVSDLVSGQINYGIADIGVPAPFVKSGKLRPIAVTGNRRASALPDVPTFAEQGVAGMEPFSPWWGLFAPAALPKAIVEKLSVEMIKIVKSPDFAAKLTNLGGDPTGLNPSASTAALNQELARWQKIIADLPGITFE
jgi:tripartite-type tricarboxylate transporter receptor subunit TctC